MSLQAGSTSESGRSQVVSLDKGTLVIGFDLAKGMDQTIVVGSVSETTPDMPTILDQSIWSGLRRSNYLRRRKKHETLKKQQSST